MNTNFTMYIFFSSSLSLSLITDSYHILPIVVVVVGFTVVISANKIQTFIMLYSNDYAIRNSLNSVSENHATHIYT